MALSCLHVYMLVYQCEALQLCISDVFMRADGIKFQLDRSVFNRFTERICIVLQVVF